MGTEIIHDKSTDTFYFNCPHCDMLCQVAKKDIKCTIFRHASYKNSNEFVPPHACEKTCKKWIEDDLVYGCAKPFKFNGEKVEKCGYI